MFPALSLALLVSVSVLALYNESVVALIRPVMYDVSFWSRDEKKITNSWDDFIASWGRKPWQGESERYWKWCTMISISIYLQDFEPRFEASWDDPNHSQSFVASVTAQCGDLWWPVGFKTCWQGVVGPRRTCEARWSAAFQPAVEGTAPTAHPLPTMRVSRMR